MRTGTAKSPLEWGEFQTLLKSVKHVAHEKNRTDLYRFLVFATISGYRGILAGDVLKMRWADVFKPYYASFNRGYRGAYGENDILKEAYYLALQNLGEKANETNNYGLILSIMPPLKSDGTKPMSIQYLNRWLKVVFRQFGMSVDNASTHTFRKTYAKHMYEQQEQKKKALIQLSHELDHSSSLVTKRYIGLLP